MGYRKYRNYIRFKLLLILAIVLVAYYATPKTLKKVPQIPVYDPTLLPGLRTWFDGTVGLTTSNWSNLGLDGGYASLCNVSISTHNGLDCALFHRQTSYGSYLETAGTGNRCVFATFKTNSQTPDSSYILTTGMNTPYNWSVSANTDLQNNSIFSIVNNTQVINVLNTLPVSGLDLTQMQTLAITYDSAGSNANSYLIYNGTNFPITYSSAGTLNTSEILMWLNGGESVSGTNTADGITLCELLVYTVPVTPTDGSNVLQYLKKKWATP